MRTQFTVIGIPDSINYILRSQDILDIIKENTFFSGGKRHYELLKPLLPEDAVWIEITPPLDNVFQQYDYYEKIVVFASGDPLFYGFGSTILKRRPDADVFMLPSFNSLQLLSHYLQLSYEDMIMISLTGRPWHELDRALIENRSKIGILTDHVHTPAAIAMRLLKYNFTQYKMYIGEHLGNPEKQRVSRSLALSEVEEHPIDSPNCVILERMYNDNIYRPLGIPDKMFELLDGRERMITKAPIRILDMSALMLPMCNHFWDIGFCTGSISIEAKRQYPHLHIHAFEIRKECWQLMENNSSRLGAPGIDVHIGDFMEEEVSDLPAPDAVFIGGHGGKLKEIINKVARYLAPDGLLVFNSVSEESEKLFIDSVLEAGLKLDDPLHITVGDYNPIVILKAFKEAK
ncbi:precorrin-6y C5,15-methyltransferase (decarboxylating) subunit CbiE [Parabacteroides leei]|uniref:precorrin-6y C5,15-methyltransferase (decarboxylating) subunit CbiE n=2 Tax=Parabacteroides TaxID=375288 RepID=UPI00189C1F22|nr:MULTISPECIES: precorrin-6y C5,15-methyltransferase (decarboxylating) subunit CbiE [Parabacteroides]MCL3850856.1 precorrin-6y C5,15-methyltransferase (decarboxylating) subunit CbiE [Parabacteroides leei]